MSLQNRFRECRRLRVNPLDSSAGDHYPRRFLARSRRDLGAIFCRFAGGAAAVSFGRRRGPEEFHAYTTMSTKRGHRLWRRHRPVLR